MCPLPDQAPGTPSKEPCSETNHHNIPITNQGSGARITTLLEGKPHHTQNRASLHAWRLFQKQESLIFHHVILIRSPQFSSPAWNPCLGCAEQNWYQRAAYKHLLSRGEARRKTGRLHQNYSALLQCPASGKSGENVKPGALASRATLPPRAAGHPEQSLGPRGLSSLILHGYDRHLPPPQLRSGSQTSLIAIPVMDEMPTKHCPFLSPSRMAACGKMGSLIHYW